MKRREMVLVSLALLLVCFAAAAPPPQNASQGQQQEKKEHKKGEEAKPQQPPPQKQEEQPLVTRKHGLRSSRQTVDSASLGVNGAGQVDAALLQASPTSEDYEKASEMEGFRISRAELDKFLSDGNLGGGGQ